MRRAWLVVCLAVIGCGGQAPDLFEVRRSGADRNANLTLLVSDGGTVTCDGHEHPISNEQLLAARGLARELAQQAELNLALPPGPTPVLSYRVRMAGGEVVVCGYLAPAAAVVQQADRVHLGRQRGRLRDLAPLTASSASAAPSSAARSAGRARRGAPRARTTRRRRPASSSSRPAAVAVTSVARASSGCGSRVTSPARSSAVTIRVIVGERTCSASASRPTVSGPPNTTTLAPKAGRAAVRPRRPRGARRAAGGSPPNGACPRARNSIALLPIVDGPRDGHHLGRLQERPARAAGARQRPRRARRLGAVAVAVPPPP